MIRTPERAVYFTADELATATSRDRRVYLESIVNGMLDGDASAGSTIYWLGRDLVDIPEVSPRVELCLDTPTSHGKLKTSMSLRLARDTDRLHGFVSAIKRWPEQSGIIDVGCGPFPILALAAALYHPKAEVTAVEINQEAADSAQEFINQFELAHRVHVTNGDIANYHIDPNTTAAVTETFNAALQNEPGPKIVRLLHQRGVPTITPSTAELRLRVSDSTFHQGVDLRTDTHANIPFDGIDSAHDIYSRPDICAQYYDDFGLVLPYDTDIISSGLPFHARRDLAEVLVGAHPSGMLTYELGICDFMPTVSTAVPV